MFDLKTVFTVTQFARQLNEQFRNQFSAVRVQGEIASFTKASSGHWYFGLKDDNAQIKAVMFRARNVLAGFSPVVGDKVEVLAQLALYEQRGELQLIVDVIKKSGQGNLHEQFLQLKARLAGEGLFDAARKKKVPDVVFSLGVVTSLQAAALADVQQALARRAPHVKYSVYHTPVQGDAASQQIVSALQQADRAGHDALVLCRGGGSLEDLWCFNTEAVVRAVAACKTPIVVGVGHETDVTLAEFAADLRAATPTAAAELISRPTSELLSQVQGLNNLLRRALRHRFQLLTQQLDRAELALLTPSAYVDALAARLVQAENRLPAIVGRQLSQTAAQLERSRNELPELARVAMSRAEQQTQTSARLLQSARTQQLSHMESRLQRLDAVLAAVSPQRTLERGYAFLQPERGAEVVRSVSQVEKGQTLRATVTDGEIFVKVSEKSATNEDSH